jgi:hypothetical protein
MAEYRVDGKVRHVIKPVDLGGLRKWIDSNFSREWNVEAHFHQRGPVRARGMTWMTLKSIVRTQDGSYFARGHRVGIAVPERPGLFYHPTWQEIRRREFQELPDEWIDGISRDQAAHWLKEAEFMSVLMDPDDYFGLVPEATPKSATEARDKFIYQEALKVEVSWKTIMTAVNKQKEWDSFTDVSGVRKAAMKYAKQKNLPPIPTRQPGRRNRDRSGTI